MERCEKRAAPAGVLAELRRRALGAGAAALDNHELLALLSGDGSAPAASPDLLELAAASPSEIAEARALPRSAALQLAAAFELSRRLASARRPPREALQSASQVFALCAADYRGEEREAFQVLLLDGKHRLKAREVVSVGSLTTSIVHPREVFRPAVRHAAAAVICVHNHPSGDPEPSPEDLEVTRRLHQAGRLLGVPLLDHVVLGDGRWVSLRERLAL